MSISGGIFKHPGFRKVNRVLNVAGLIFVAMLVSTHAAFAWKAHGASEHWEERIFVIDEAWQFRFLYPLGGQAIGFTLPPLSVGYVNRAAIEVLGTDIEGVRRHEAKHLEQADQLGLARYYGLETWKREGIAEYIRGGPTISVCAPSVDENPNRLAYRSYYVVVKYLIEELGLSEEDIYALDGAKLDSYPLEAAEEWLNETECSSP